MKQVLLNLENGDITVENVPVPVLKKGVVVQNAYSVISAGTEGSLLNLADKNLLGKAKERPDLAKKVLDKVSTDGLLTAYQQAMSRLAKPEALGYSCAGIVTESNVSEFQIGDRVACAGAGYASHAEYVSIPQNLCVKIPENVSLRDACYATVGAIAMQGVRNAKLSVGENVVVIGLGLIGLLAVQIVKASGCRVFAVDVDSAKIKLAKELGADIATNYVNVMEKLAAFSKFGADAVIIAASTKSNDPITISGDMVREHGRVVALGLVGMDLPRDKYYDKEAEVVVSRSYGPGRYDRNYEEKGIDYPILVRWTEKRNMESFLNLIAEGKVLIEPILTHEFSVEDAVAAYNLIHQRTEPFIGVTLRYDLTSHEDVSSKIPVTAVKKTGGNSRKVGLIGAGIHATSSLLPAMKNLPLEKCGIATATGLTAQSVAKKYGFVYCTADYHEVLNDAEIDSVIIATRNDLHAGMVVEALQAGKKVFVEKPLATTVPELEEIANVRKETDGYVQVGFNRRYSSLTRKLCETFRNHTTPLVIHYRVNAGPIPPELWVNDAEQGGGMLISECCHFIDYVIYLTGSKPVEVYAKTIEPKGNQNKYSNLQIIISMEDGSIGTVTYSTMGDKAFSKEQVEVIGDGACGVLTDFREVTIVKGGKKSSLKVRLSQDKGFVDELKLFAEGTDDDFSTSYYAMLATLKAKESVELKKPVGIE